MKHQIIPVTAYQQNCTLLWCEKTMKGAIVDPGGELDRIWRAVEDNQVEVEKILITHGHIDHAGGTAELSRCRHLPIEGPHSADRFWIDALENQASMFGMSNVEIFQPDRWLEDGDTVMVGETVLQVRHCPGHTPGHVIFFSESDKLALVGDVLFMGSIGRTDFPMGDYQTLITSIKQKLWPLGNEVSFICGHGPMSTFGRERASNPFVGDHAG